MGDFRPVTGSLREFALSFPEAYEDFPWGECVIKVNKKIFVFLGMAEPLESECHVTVKLPASSEAALVFPFSSLPGYGLGRANWVTMKFSADDEVPLDLVRDWIEESYRAIAPKRLVAQL